MVEAKKIIYTKTWNTVITGIKSAQLAKKTIEAVASTKKSEYLSKAPLPNQKVQQLILSLHKTRNENQHYIWNDLPSNSKELEKQSDTVQELVSAYYADKNDVFFRFNIIIILGHNLKDQKMTADEKDLIGECLVKSLKDSSALVRAEAAYALQFTENIKYFAEVDVFTHDPDSNVQSEAKKTVSHLAALAIGTSGAGAVAADGTVWIWGTGLFDEILPPINQMHIARQVKGIDNVTSIGIARRYMVAVKSDGSVWQIGIPPWNTSDKKTDDTNKTNWIQIKELDNIKSVLVNRYATFALKRDGSVWGLGRNDWGRLGSKFKGNSSSKPIKLTDLSAIRALYDSTWGDAYWAVQEDGIILSWGKYSRIGFPYDHDHPTEFITEPLNLSALVNVTKLAVSTIGVMESNSVALQKDGSVIIFGNLVSACDNKTLLPLKIPGLNDVVSIAIAVVNVYAVKKDGSLWSWGNYEDYSSTHCTEKPEQLMPAGSAIAVQAHGLENYVILKDGTVWIWGINGGLDNGFNYLIWPNRKQILGLPAVMADTISFYD